ncbi:PREDICTED: actin-related protein 2/3 complex subunit 2B [Tarenaya hassleriana]|uniref:actin-related protein 2/3 complex subunit 2B n=1 Tax=Tarenaya hassleriana TaxID=28532 RepID=UPI00053C319E|nr:PREDICTED: actin-related protein 2/3 complex subunit 2B [Tarenaya hassleriana]
MGYLQRASPMLKETLLKIHRAEKPLEIDQHFYEFGSIQYHIKCSVSDPKTVYLSTSTSLDAQGTATTCEETSTETYEVIKGIAMGVIDIVEPPELGFQLTLRLHFDQMPRGKGALKIITKMSEMQAIILSCQMKMMLRNASVQMMNKPIKIVYRTTEPFYVFKKPHEITAVFPMRFKDHTDVVIATSFFQELVEVGNQKEMGKAPQCNWSPIPPPELTGEPLHDLSTNAGFVSFDITSRHIEGGKRLDNTVWNLLNFYAYVKYHIKCSRGFIQRRMRKRMESLVEVLNNTTLEDDEPKENRRCKYVKRLGKIPRAKMVKQRCKEMTTRVKRSKFHIKINGCARFRLLFHRRSISFPNFTSNSSGSYIKLD